MNEFEATLEEMKPLRKPLVCPGWEVCPGGEVVGSKRLRQKWILAAMPV